MVSAMVSERKFTLNLIPQSSLQLHGSIAIAHRFKPNPTCNALINCYSQIPEPTLGIIQSCALDSASKLTILP
jgi:hypothetical protein